MDMMPAAPVRDRLPDGARLLFESVEERQLIDGALVASCDLGTLDVLDPSTGGVLGRAPAAGEADVAAAVAAAVRAFPAWRDTAARARGKAVAEGARRIEAEIADLAPLLALETGKAIRTECRPELGSAVDILSMYAGLAGELKGETVPYDPGMLAYTLREPLGVVAAILPWNVPLVLMMLKIAPALVAGNTVVVKASEEAPFATIAAAKLLADALPPGVLNVICGTGADCGGPLVLHPRVAKVTFTGSQPVGEAIHAMAATKLMPVSLELGGKSPMIVFGDADLDRAVEGAFAGMRFTRMGQSCTASSRIYVHRSLYDRFLDALVLRLEKMVIGDPLDEATDAGAVVNVRQKQKIEALLVEGASADGVELRAVGRLPEDPRWKDGLFVLPVLCLGAAEDNVLMREEIFGPVTCLVPFDNDAAVLQAANDSDFGLAATLWTRDLKRGLTMAQRIEAGFIQVNRTLTIQPNLAYGGFKKSGLGKEASLAAMLEHFTRVKTVVVDLG
jgi:betaine-aldehyde dehydrogenase